MFWRESRTIVKFQIRLPQVILFSLLNVTTQEYGLLTNLSFKKSLCLKSFKASSCLSSAKGVNSFKIIILRILPGETGLVHKLEYYIEHFYASCISRDFRRAIYVTRDHSCISVLLLGEGRYKVARRYECYVREAKTISH